MAKSSASADLATSNAYPARLVLESVADVTPKPVDYSASDAILKKDKTSQGPDNNRESGPTEEDPISDAQKLAAGLAGSPVVTQIQADLTLLPQGKKPGEINISYGRSNEVSANDRAPSAADSSDGVLYNCTFDRDRLSEPALTLALMHMAQHAADARTVRPQT